MNTAQMILSGGDPKTLQEAKDSPESRMGKCSLSGTKPAPRNGDMAISEKTNRCNPDSQLLGLLKEI